MRSQTALTRTSLMAASAVSLAGMLVVAPSAHAQGTFYLTEAAFLAKVQPNYFDEPFASAATAATSYSYLQNGYGYNVTAGTGLVKESANDVFTNSANRTLIVTFTTGNVTAVGGNFYNTDNSDAFSSSLVDVTVNYVDGNTDEVTYTPAGEGAFRGVTSPVAISSIVFAAPGVLKSASIGELITGAAAPDANSVALLVAGALPLAGLVIRRRRTV